MAKNKNTVVNRILHTVTDLRVREAQKGEAASRTITGYAILFGVPSAPLYDYDDEEAREVIAPGAVTKELLDGCDIKMTMFHDRQLILARSKNGAGTLTYGVDDKGVYFEFDAPNTVDGDKALELVRRGDISGCSFMFSTHYYDSALILRWQQTRHIQIPTARRKRGNWLRNCAPRSRSNRRTKISCASKCAKCAALLRNYYKI